MNSNSIIPGKSIGDYEIGWTYNQLVDKLAAEYKVEEYEPGKKIYFNNFRFWINNTSKTVEQISVVGNFSGKFQDKIGIGSTLKDVEMYFKKWHEEVDEVYTIPDYKGMCFEIKDVDDFDEDWIEEKMPINVISVYKPKER